MTSSLDEKAVELPAAAVCTADKTALYALGFFSSIVTVVGALGLAMRGGTIGRILGQTGCISAIAAGGSIGLMATVLLCIPWNRVHPIHSQSLEQKERETPPLTAGVQAHESVEDKATSPKFVKPDTQTLDQNQFTANVDFQEGVGTLTYSSHTYCVYDCPVDLRLFYDSEQKRILLVEGDQRTCIADLNERQESLDISALRHFVQLNGQIDELNRQLSFVEAENARDAIEKIRQKVKEEVLEVIRKRQKLDPKNLSRFIFAQVGPAFKLYIWSPSKTERELFKFELSEFKGSITFEEIPRSTAQRVLVGAQYICHRLADHKTLLATEVITHFIPEYRDLIFNQVIRDSRPLQSFETREMAKAYLRNCWGTVNQDNNFVWLRSSSGEFVEVPFLDGEQLRTDGSETANYYFQVLNCNWRLTQDHVFYFCKSNNDSMVYYVSITPGNVLEYTQGNIDKIVKIFLQKEWS